ncbi:NAD-dependent malic enzyme [bacterium HR37]|jgi:malate dehydrogenase (oxaloacetate-decarboxylating)|nr:NAD-dependent malic enzyme [bacterium HR37]
MEDPKIVPPTDLVKPSPGYTLIIRCIIQNEVGMLGRVTTAIGEAGGDIGAIDLVGFQRDKIIRDITVKVKNEEHGQQLIDHLKKVKGLEIAGVSDRTFLLHIGGKIQIKSKIPLENRYNLSMAYTPGVARVSMAIHKDPRKVFQLTIKKNTVAIVTDGSAVLGLGDIGPEAALPVMEGKAMIFKEFADVDAFPICLATKDVEEIIRTVKVISPVFGGINLEDISSPRCFEIEERLKRELEIPVIHDDQHCTAVVVLAALFNALRIVKKEPDQIKVVIAGVGAAGVGTTKLLLTAGVRNIIGCDIYGAIYRGMKEGMDPVKRWYAEHTNPENLKGDLASVIEGADVFIGVSVGGVLKPEYIRKMNRDPIVFALANPIPEIMPEEAQPYARIIATGRSDYPNQINNALCFPGLFRGVLDCRAREINDEMKIAAARAIASIVAPKELSEEYIIPSIFNKKVVKAVATEVIKAAYRTGSARRQRVPMSIYHI